jgi:hypothetical protein
VSLAIGMQSGGAECRIFGVLLSRQILGGFARLLGLKR